MKKSQFMWSVMSNLESNGSGLELNIVVVEMVIYTGKLLVVDQWHARVTECTFSSCFYILMKGRGISGRF